MEVTPVTGIAKEIRRVSDPDKAQIIWDGIKVMRLCWLTMNFLSSFPRRLCEHRNKSRPCPVCLAT